MTTGCSLLDNLIVNLERDTLTTIFGGPGTGKTLTAMLAVAEIARSGKVIYIDTEGGFSLERFKQLTGENFDVLLKNIVFLHPTSFEEQKHLFERLKEILNDDIKLVVVDTISMLYRLELGKNEEFYETNRELGRHIALLSEIARTKHIPIIITNQVYANVENGKTKMVGGDILSYGSKCLIELEKFRNVRKAHLRKHRSKEEKEVSFSIVESGIDCIYS